MWLLSAIRRYAASPDPLVGAANTLALVLAGNQPFYPLYLLGLFGGMATPALVQIAVTPGFAVVPLLTRRWPLGGRIWLALVSTVNTIIYIKLIGQPSGLELFLVPCMMVGALLFRQSERMVMLALTTMPAVVYFGLKTHYGAPVIAFSTADYATMRTMNTVSVATLIGFFGILISGVLASAEKSTHSASTRNR